MERLTVRGKLDSLGDIRDFVTTVANAAGLDKKVTYRLNLAVDEIATNIITHGYDEAGREGDVDVIADIGEKALTIHIEDTGAAYDPDQLQTPDSLDQPLEQRPIGGLGVFLAIQSVDKFQYERIDERNRHTFIVNRAPEA
jgi:serine/threonine-protein kinase RsbW